MEKQTLTITQYAALLTQRKAKLESLQTEIDSLNELSAEEVNNFNLAISRYDSTVAKLVELEFTEDQIATMPKVEEQGKDCSDARSKLIEFGKIFPVPTSKAAKVVSTGEVKRTKVDYITEICLAKQKDGLNMGTFFKNKIKDLSASIAKDINAKYPGAVTDNSGFQGDVKTVGIRNGWCK